MRGPRPLALLVALALAVAGCGSAATVLGGGSSRPTWVQVSKHRAFLFWHEVPCGGDYKVVFMRLAPQLYGQFWLSVLPNGRCTVARIGLQRSVLGNVRGHAAFPLFCQVFLHEYGHLLGRQHSRNPRAVMYPVATPRNTPRVCKLPVADGDAMPGPAFAGRQ